MKENEGKGESKGHETLNTVNAEKEEFEILILEDFLPEQMSEEEIEILVTETISETAAKEPQDMGKVMGSLKSKIKGNADMGLVSKIVKEKLLS